MTTPASDRVVRELEQLPDRNRMKVVVEVMQRLGMTTPPRPGFLNKEGKRWLFVGAAVFLLGISIAVTSDLARETRSGAWLAVTTSPPYATVLIDARPIDGPGRSAIGTPPGRHLLTVMCPGYISSDRYIDLQPNQALKVDVTLQTTGFQRLRR
jgi:hypothetical protein